MQKVKLKGPTKFMIIGVVILYCPENSGQDIKNEDMQRMKNLREQLKNELGSKYDVPLPTPTAEQRALGKTIFVTNCAPCHGSQGKGDGPSAPNFDPRPANFTDPMQSGIISDKGRIQVIKKGVDGTAMPGWESMLSDEKLLSVYAYVRSLRSADKVKMKDNH
jgi:mono/diheme cytochrome c family protein